MTDLEAQPVLFIPDVHFGNLQRAGQVDPNHMIQNLEKKKNTKKTHTAAEKLFSLWYPALRFMISNFVPKEPENVEFFFCTGS